jgi:hypothetical protein
VKRSDSDLSWKTCRQTPTVKKEKGMEAEDNVVPLLRASVGDELDT